MTPHKNPDIEAKLTKIIENSGLNEYEWMVWRVVSSTQLSCSLVEVSTQWSLADLYEANLALNAIAEMSAAMSEG